MKQNPNEFNKRTTPKLDIENNLECNKTLNKKHNNTAYLCRFDFQTVFMLN